MGSAESVELIRIWQNDAANRVDAAAHLQGKDERGRFKTVSGDLRFGGGLDPNGVFEFASHGGNIELSLSETISADFLLSTHSGEIENDFRVKRGPGRRPRADLLRAGQDGLAEAAI